MTTQILGTITTWKGDRGFGFAKRDDGQPDVFIHVHHVEGERQLKVGERVSFEIEADRRTGRARAVNVKVLA